MVHGARAADRGIDRCGVYVHVPYCRRRCPYCDFYFEVRAEDARFPDAVVAELTARHGELHARPTTLSFGGGTPSHVGSETLRTIVDATRALGLTADAEVSLEANPEDVDDDQARAFVEAGITRVSLGVQSFDDGVLTYLGRAHDAARAASAVAALRQAGMAQVGIDLIVGVPGEPPTRLHDDIARAHDTGIVHVSTYLLTLEPGTPLIKLIASGKRKQIDDDAQAEAYESVQELLALRGYGQYEVSSYARPGCESRHNRLYWSQGAYLGVGPGAHSMQLLPSGAVRRRHTTARLDGWLDAPAAAAHDVEELAPAHALREALAFGLRDLLAGVDVTALAARHQTPLSPGIAAALAASERAGDVTASEGTWRLTSTGARFADRVARAILQADDLAA